MSLSFARDPFARGQRTRELVYVDEACAWCGAKPATHKGRQYLYRYGWDSDGGRSSQDARMFCCVGCRDSYHN